MKGLSSPPSEIVRVRGYQTGEVNTGTGYFTLNDVVPINTDGNEFMSFVYTPKSAANRLKVDVVIFMSNDTTNRMTAALYKDAVVNAIACGLSTGAAATGGACPIKFSSPIFVAGTNSPITFKVRGGAVTGGTATFNGEGGLRKFGGAMASGIVVTEMIP